MFHHLCSIYKGWGLQGRIQDFKLGGMHLSKNAPSGGRREHFWGISCEKSRFYAKKSNFFQLRREAQKLLGYFVWKITILRKKNYIFSNFRGACAGCAPLWYMCILIWVEKFDIQCSLSILRYEQITIFAFGFNSSFRWKIWRNFIMFSPRHTCN